MCTSLISAYCRCLQIGQWAVSWIWGSAQCLTLRTTHTVILTLLDISVLCTGRWHTAERIYSSNRTSRSSTPERAPTAYEEGWAPHVLETRSLALTGIKPRYVTRKARTLDTRLRPPGSIRYRRKGYCCKWNRSQSLYLLSYPHSINGLHRGTEFSKVRGNTLTPTLSQYWKTMPGVLAHSLFLPELEGGWGEGIVLKTQHTDLVINIYEYYYCCFVLFCWKSY
jgi:hypothetical protein